MPLFTRHHYQPIASALRAACDAQRAYPDPSARKAAICHLARALADLFTADNPSFNRTAFLQAVIQLSADSTPTISSNEG